LIDGADAGVTRSGNFRQLGFRALLISSRGNYVRFRSLLAEKTLSMAPSTRRPGLAYKDGLKQVVRQGSKWLERFKSPPESADFRAWRHQFLRDRFQICLWIAFPCYFTLVLQNIYEMYLRADEFNEQVTRMFGDPSFADRCRDVSMITNWVIGILLIACFILQKTAWGKRYPAQSFLIGTLMQLPTVDPSGWSLVFLAQAALMPVNWRLHLLSQGITLLYYVGVNPFLGLTQVGDVPIYNSGIFIYLFWFCAICDLGVYMYEQLKRAEFESQRQLKVFLHSVSHDLRTPVMGTSIVLQNLLKTPDAKISIDRSVLERLLQGSDRQLTLINSLLEAHDCEVQASHLHYQPLPLHTLVTSVLAELGSLLDKHDIIVINRVSPDLPLVYADSDQLWRVYSNLITNALKHNPSGITLTLDAEVISSLPRRGHDVLEKRSPHQSFHLTSAPDAEKGVWSALHPATKFLRCTVQDNGIGIDPYQSQHLFELYSRGKRARYMPGIGLGLYLCRQIIQAHGGQIDVISRPNQGSTFWFTLRITD
jgi:signal transduction histidine kinase